MSKKNLIFLALTAAIFFLFFGFALAFGLIFNEDSPEYLNMAYNIRHFGHIYSRSMSLPHDPFFESLRPPVYGLFIMLVKFVSESNYAILFVQNCFSILMFFGLYRMIEKHAPSRYNLWLILAAIVLFPTTLRLSNSVLADQLFAILFFGAFWSMLQYFENRKLKFIVIYNLLLIIGLFTKPVLAYFWIPNLIFSIYLYTKHKSLIILFMPLLLPMLVHLWCLRNERQTGYYHFSSIISQDIIEYNSYQLMVSKFGRHHADSVREEIRQQAAAIPDFKTRTIFLETKGKEIILAYPFTYAKVHLSGVMAFFLDPGRLDLLSFFPIPKGPEISFFQQIRDKGPMTGVIYYFAHIQLWLLLIVALIFIWNILLTLSFALFVFYRKIPLEIRLFTLMMVGYIAALSVNVGFSRFRNAVYPILVFGAVWWMVEFLNQKSAISPKE